MRDWGGASSVQWKPSEPCGPVTRDEASDEFAKLFDVLNSCFDEGVLAASRALSRGEITFLELVAKQKELLDELEAAKNGLRQIQGFIDLALGE